MAYIVLHNNYAISYYCNAIWYRRNPGCVWADDMFLNLENASDQFFLNLYFF